ncbi:hypothetical protein F5Y10DRAFT_117682 [Nemania abortiva]|nr:hypothetical protein F5Y10DRAFT_117682 [Nemania abortiva]
MSHKAPSAGTKVSAGRDDATIQEGPGAVKPDSLAAESEAFREANMGGTESQQQRPQEGNAAAAAAPSYPRGAMPGETGSGQREGARSAPTYVDNQYRRDPSGAHGKNIKEDDSIGTGAGAGDSGAKNASFEAEIGSKDDPSLLAERKMFQANATAAGSTGGRERTVEDANAYDVLGDQGEKTSEGRWF